MHVPLSPKNADDAKQEGVGEGGYQVDLSTSAAINDETTSVFLSLVVGL